MPNMKTVDVALDEDEFEKMRANARRYETILEHLRALVMVTPNGSVIMLKAENRGAHFNRQGMNAALDGLASGISPAGLVHEQRESAAADA